MKGLLASFALATLVTLGLVLALGSSVLLAESAPDLHSLTEGSVNSAESGLDLPGPAEGGVAPGDILCVVLNPGSLLPSVDCTRVFTTIQPAVDAATSGEEIRIAAGTYTDVHARPGNVVGSRDTVTQMVFITKSLTLQGGYPPDMGGPPDPATHPTVLDARGRGRVLAIGEDITVTVAGLRLTGGNADGLLGGESFCPGSICIPTHAGGGVYVSRARVILRDNTIVRNTAQAGGGVYLHTSEATLEGNRIVTNSAGVGGGIAAYDGDLDLRRNVIRSNTAFTSSHTALLFVSGDGGGLHLATERAELTNNVIADNRAARDGSGLYSGWGSQSLLHNTFARNGSDGPAPGASGKRNGIYVHWSRMALTNTVMVSHTVGITCYDAAHVTLLGVLWHGTEITVGGACTTTVSATHQISGAPAFAADGYHLTAGSAAINRGVRAGVLVDVDGERRDPWPDLGADEFQHPLLYLPVVRRSCMCK